MGGMILNCDSSKTFELDPYTSLVAQLNMLYTVQVCGKERLPLRDCQEVAINLIG